MAITLGHLCKYAKENYQMTVVCGEKHMNNLVNWVHMLEDPETAYFLHGRELIITTGIGQDNTDWFVDFVKGLVKKDASGLVLNIGPYIPSVPKELLDYCKEVDFPLLTIPWETRIVDVTNDFCRKIIKAEEKEVSVAGAFRNAIFSPEKTGDYQKILEREGFKLDEEFCVLALTLQAPSKSELLAYDKKIRSQLTRSFFNFSDRFNIFGQDKYLIVVLQSYPSEIIQKALDQLHRISNKGYEVRAGISAYGMGIQSLSKSYKRAISVLKLAKKQNKAQLYYDEIGLYQVLIEVDDINVLKRFYYDSLGHLDDYDEKNQTDYSTVLKCYLDNNNSVEKVAQATYVHRNTVNYKIRKIKEILKCNLDYEDGLKLLLAYYIKEFF